MSQLAPSLKMLAQKSYGFVKKYFKNLPISKIHLTGHYVATVKFDCQLNADFHTKKNDNKLTKIQKFFKNL